MSKKKEQGQKPQQVNASRPLSYLLDEDFLSLLSLVRQVLENGQVSQTEFGIIIKSKAAWTALKNASDYYETKGI